MVQLSHPYMTTEKTVALTRQTFVGKVMSLLFSRYSIFDKRMTEGEFNLDFFFIKLHFLMR